jgi:hypothetical protein
MIAVDIFRRLTFKLKAARRPVCNHSSAQVLPDELFDAPPEEDEPLLPELVAPEPLEGAALELLLELLPELLLELLLELPPELLPEVPLELLLEDPPVDLLPELSDDGAGWLPAESPEPALASPPEAAEPPAAASAPATGAAASLVFAPPVPLLRKSVTYHPEPFN